jgi:hypothetical protein
LLLKNRLENTETFFRDSAIDLYRSKFNEKKLKYLYNRLNQFEKLRILALFEQTNDDIKYMETITEKCVTVKNIKFVSSRN